MPQEGALLSAVLSIVIGQLLPVMKPVFGGFHSAWLASWYVFLSGLCSPGPHLRREVFVLYQASNSLASVGLCCLVDHLLR